ncbi:unnamed protein product [Clonostachys solani]|uniref:Uncharacterized protein n=1 Tax=Clonostachys solani TaxID=160281 RepID=A0A9N9ZJS7_9HYPO|nr:unnamed protein product [Clonostachys solani]
MPKQMTKMESITFATTHLGSKYARSSAQPSVIAHGRPQKGSIIAPGHYPMRAWAANITTTCRAVMRHAGRRYTAKSSLARHISATEDGVTTLILSIPVTLML